MLGGVGKRHWSNWSNASLERRTIRASHGRFWQRKVLHLCCGDSQCDTDAGTSQLGVMEHNLIALAFDLLQQMKNSDSNDFKIHK